MEAEKQKKGTDKHKNEASKLKNEVKAKGGELAMSAANLKKVDDYLQANNKEVKELWAKLQKSEDQEKKVTAVKDLALREKAQLLQNRNAELKVKDFILLTNNC